MIAAVHAHMHRRLTAQAGTHLAYVSRRFCFDGVFFLSSAPDVLLPPALPPVDRGTGSAVVLPFLLHGVDETEQRVRIKRACALAPYLILIDYRCPERNLDFPACWLASGMELLAPVGHRTAWRRFMAQGGVEALMHPAPSSAPLLRIPICGGAVSLSVMAGSQLAGRSDLSRPAP